MHLHYPISAVHAGIWRFRKQLWRQDLPATRPESDTDSCIRSTGTGFPQTDDRVHFLCGGSSTSTLRCFSASWWSDHVKTLTDGRAFNTASSSSTDQLSLVLANNNTSSFVSYFLIINLTLSNKCSSVKDTGFPSEMCQDVFLTVLDHMMPLFNNINQNMTKNQTISHQKPVLLWVLDQYSANHMNADHGFNFQLILSWFQNKSAVLLRIHK